MKRCVADECSVFLKTTIAAVPRAYEKAENVPEKKILTQSPGGRSVYMLA